MKSHLPILASFGSELDLNHQSLQSVGLLYLGHRSTMVVTLKNHSSIPTVLASCITWQSRNTHSA